MQSTDESFYPGLPRPKPKTMPISSRRDQRPEHESWDADVSQPLHEAYRIVPKIGSQTWMNVGPPEVANTVPGMLTGGPSMVPPPVRPQHTDDPRKQPRQPTLPPPQLPQHEDDPGKQPRQPTVPPPTRLLHVYDTGEQPRQPTVPPPARILPLSPRPPRARGLVQGPAPDPRQQHRHEGLAGRVAATSSSSTTCNRDAASDEKLAATWLEMCQRCDSAEDASEVSSHVSPQPRQPTEPPPAWQQHDPGQQPRQPTVPPPARLLHADDPGEQPRQPTEPPPARLLHADDPGEQPRQPKRPRLVPPPHRPQHEGDPTQRWPPRLVLPPHRPQHEGDPQHVTPPHRPLLVPKVTPQHRPQHEGDPQPRQHDVHNLIERMACNGPFNVWRP
jgi:hypothetical protein